MDYKTLREKYKEFEYKEFSAALEGSDLKVKFLFACGEFEFSPSVVFKDIPLTRYGNLNRETLNNLFFHLGMAEILSYWKAFTSPKITVSAGGLNSKQLEWWKDLLIQGMGQFFYENNIDATSDDFVEILSSGTTKFEFDSEPVGGGILIPVGGGKDSAVTLELFKDENSAAFMINPTQAALDIARESGIDKKITVERNLDKKLLELNDNGFLNGHTPFSSVVAFLAVTAAYIYGYSEIALSNERSSNEENTTYLGKTVNHQYSKTFEFENKFREYVGSFLVPVNYFSFLRPLYEIQIAKIFSKMDKYFLLFRSCNVGQKTNSWCGNCSKCLSTYILLMRFLPQDKLNSIFGEDLLAKPSLQNILSELIDPGKVKPFECVGTRQELTDAVENKLDILKEWNGENNLPEKYERLLRDEIQK